MMAPKALSVSHTSGSGALTFNGRQSPHPTSTELYHSTDKLHQTDVHLGLLEHTEMWAAPDN